MIAAGPGTHPQAGAEVRAAAAAAAFEHTADGLAVIAADPDRGYPIVDANPRMADLASCPPEELIGRPARELAEAGEAGQLAHRVEEVAATGHPLHYQVERQAPAGRRTYQVAVHRLAGLGRGQPHVAAIIREVTALRRVTETLADLQHVADIGHWSCDNYLARIHPDDRRRVGDAVRHTLQTGQPFEFDHRIVTPDGAVRRLHCRGVRITDASGRPVRLTGTARRVHAAGNGAA